MRKTTGAHCTFEFKQEAVRLSAAIGVHDAASLLTAEKNAEACAEGWSLFTHLDDTVELRLAHMDSPMEGDGALPDDAAAWHRVRTRATPLHLKVIDILSY